MNGNITCLKKDGRVLCVYLPEHTDKQLPVLCMLAGPDPVLELTGPAERAEEAAGRGECRPFAAIAVGGGVWNSDYTPWPAPPLFEQEPPFTGESPDFLRWLTGDALPFIETRFPVKAAPEERSILGYSLAGLTALYAMYTTDAFGGCGCCSGSLWYDGWADFLTLNRPRPGSRIYLSLGTHEENAKNPRAAAVGDATRAAHARFQDDPAVVETELHWHDGGHFANVPQRISAAMIWLCR